MNRPGLGESIWDIYRVRGQPVSVPIKRGVVVKELFGSHGEDVLIARITN
jgi:hypothetical protein